MRNRSRRVVNPRRLSTVGRFVTQEEVDTIAKPGHEPPAWLVHHVQRLQYLLGARDDYEWWVVVEDNPSITDNRDRIQEHGAQGFYAAVTDANPRAAEAYLSFKREIENDKEGRVTIAHEVLHVYMARSQRTAYHLMNIIGEEVGKAAGDLAEAMWYDAHENEIQRLAVHLAGLLAPGHPVRRWLDRELR